MKVLVIGLGSVALKHIEALKILVPDVNIIALRSHHSSQVIEGVENIFSWDEIPLGISFIIISNPTSEHLNTIIKSIEIGVPLFIEKPPLLNLIGAEALLKILSQKRILAYVAFSMRFHPVIEWLNLTLKEKHVLEVNVYCGSYLPDWRPKVDYRSTYSAKREMGGGVQLDLIHELDYIVWFFGYPKSVFCDTDKVSGLHIDSSDFAHYYLKYDRFNVSIILNYYRRDPKRQIEIVFEDDTWIADLMASTVTNMSGEVLFSKERSRLTNYLKQMEHFLTQIDSDSISMNNFEESIKTLKICLNSGNEE